MDTDTNGPHAGSSVQGKMKGQGKAMVPGRAGRHLRQRWHLLRRWRRWLAGALGLTLLAIVGLAAWVLVDLPDVSRIEAGLALPSTRIYDRNGTLLYEIQSPEEGRNVPILLQDVPQHCVDAIIATEDANYWSHPGVDMEGVARALWLNLRGGEIVAGGSTITQQTARLLLLDPISQAERSLRRKLREMALAVQLQTTTSKEHVLALYLNQVYFGNLAYGIEAAARTYFHKSAPALSLSECSMLAGIVQNAVYNDPLTRFDRARQRQQVVLRLMVERGYIDGAEASAAYSDALQFGSARFPIEAPHFVMAVWKQLERDYPDQLYQQGLDVYTTVDANWQNIAQRVAQQQLASLNDPQVRVPANASNAAVVALDPSTGEILTLLGSPDYFDEAIDGAVNAALAMRQPGSTLKPFTYAMAMDPDNDAPFTAATVLMDLHTPFITRRLESYAPGNYGLVERGPVRIREALASSYNIPAVATLDVFGIDRFRELLDRVGLHQLAGNTDVDLSITLGGGEVTLLDLTSAYASFANTGYRIDPVFITRIVRRDDGEVLYQWQKPTLTQRVFDERVAFLISDILSDNDARLPNFGPNSPLQVGRQVAAKTGTTTDFRDNWVVGYTPQVVVGVWVGNSDNQPMRDVTGVTGAGPIYNLFIRQIMAEMSETTFVPPDGMTQVDVCALSGLLPTDACSRRYREWFIEGTEPTGYDSWYQTISIDRRNGRVATADTPSDEQVSQVYVVLPQEARDWGLRNGYPPVPDGVEIVNQDPLRLLTPDPYTRFEISTVVPRETQRIRWRIVYPSDTVSVRYRLNDKVVGTVDATPFTLWWPLQVGSWSLVAEATQRDGSVIVSDGIPFTVLDATDAPLLQETAVPAAR